MESPGNVGLQKQNESETLLLQDNSPIDVAVAARAVVDYKSGRKFFYATTFVAVGLFVTGLLATIVFLANTSKQSVPIGSTHMDLIHEGETRVDDPCSVGAGSNCEVTKKLEGMLPAKHSCAEPGQNCSESKCCAWDGMQCYRKNKQWASCKVSCVPGPDLSDMDSHPWSCEKLGKRTSGKAHVMKFKIAEWVKSKCSKPGEDCSHTKCCAWDGMQCHVKHDHWATCRPSCVPGPDPTDTDNHPWNCTALGPRTPGISAVKFEAMKPASWVATNCSQPGDNCYHTKCCAQGGMQCYEKNDHQAGCKTDCVPGPDLTDDNPDPWTCKALGYRTPGVHKMAGEVKLADWVDSKCSLPGQNCTDSKCCKYEGMQCFRKNDHWASCRYFCHAGPDPTDVNNHFWNCTALGPLTPGKSVTSTAGSKSSPWVKSFCAKPGEDCSEKKCCALDGEQCYEKNEHWSTCRSSCNAGPDPRDTNPNPWSCKPLGFQTPGKAMKPSPNVKVPAWVASHCSKSGQNCHDTKCCADHGTQCFEKNQYWAVCMSFCTSGKDDRGEDWSCKKLGSRTPKPWGSPSLYCFSVLRSSGYEPGLMEAQMKIEAGIFKCDGYDLACSEEFMLGGKIKALKFQGAPVGMSIDHTAGNTQLFMNVWTSIKARGKYARFDWTVKADPDAVIVPERLRTHLKPHTGSKAYIVNCDKPTMIPMMFGSLETFTKNAIQAYFDGAERCKNDLQWGGWGEDYFMGMCLDHLGVTKVNDFQIISDGVCKQVNCFDGNAAAFHPFKQVGAWLDCFSHTQGR